MLCATSQSWTAVCASLHVLPISAVFSASPVVPTAAGLYEVFMAGTIAAGDGDGKKVCCSKLEQTIVFVLLYLCCCTLEVG